MASFARIIISGSLSSLFFIVNAIPSGYNVSTPTTLPVASQLIENGLTALGGENALRDIRGITYYCPRIYRSQTLMQNYNLIKSDQFVSIEGHQNISYSLSSEGLLQRIDRHFIPSDYWIWGKGTLDPIDYSLVVKGGQDGFACFVRGNNYIYMPSDYTSGYTDAPLADYLVTSGSMMSPHLLLQMKQNNASSSFLVSLHGAVDLPAVTDLTSNLTMIFDPETSLPYIIRSYEEHPIFGFCTKDLQLSNYTTVSGIQFPQRFQTVYNTPLSSDAVLEDFLVESIEMNPLFPPTFFNGLPSNESDTPRTTPARDPEYSSAEIGEGFSNMIYGFDSLPEWIPSASHPLGDDVPQVWNLMFENSSYAQLIMEFEDGVIVADAPMHQSRQTIQWVAENLKKPITHLWPSHHHRDHTGGAADFVKAGAKIIVPEIAVDYWSSIPNASLVTYTKKLKSAHPREENPYVHKDGSIQAWFMWRKEAVHAVDWSYAMVTKACPSMDDGVVVFNADAWSPGTNATRWDQGFARQWLDQILDDGLTVNVVVVPAHGVPTPLRELLDITGYMYPNLNTLDWKSGALKC